MLPANAGSFFGWPTGDIMIAVSRASLVRIFLAALIVGIGGTQAIAKKKHPDSVIMIHNVTELQNIQHNLAGNYQLANDIDASKAENFVPIGGGSSAFTGALDGNGFAIQNLSSRMVQCFDSNSICAGLFAHMKGAARNLRLTNATIRIRAATNKYAYGGIIAAINEGLVQSAYVQGSITGSGAAAEIDIGGIAGANLVEISRSVSNVSVSVTDKSTQFVRAGGLAGESCCDSNTVLQAYSLGTVSVQAASGEVGGLLGINGGVVRSSFALGKVEVADNALAGGLVGSIARSGEIYDSFATGTVTAGSQSTVGGLVGVQPNSSVQRVYAYGSVSAGTNSTAGGLIGAQGGCYPCFASVDQSYSLGAVKVGSGGNAGGLIGKTDYNANTNSYWDLNTSGIGDPSKGCGNVPSCAGVMGLKTKDFKGKIPDGLNAPDWMQVKFPIRLESIDSQITDYPKLWALTFPIPAFPLGGEAAYGSNNSNPAGAKVVSVMDHSMPWEPAKNGGALYRCDDIAMAFNGAMGQRKYGTDDPKDKCIAPGYAQDSNQTPFDLGGVNYYGVSGNTKLLNYDGHPGYDYVANYEPVYAATSGMIYYPLEAVGMMGNPNHAYCFFHALGEVPDAAKTYRLYYLHLSTHPAGIDPYSPACSSPGDTKGQTVTIQSGWIDPKCVYRDQTGAKFTPVTLPLLGGTHVEVPAGKFCVIAQSGEAGAGAPHLHFEIQQFMPDTAIPAGANSNFAKYFRCFNEDDYKSLEAHQLCVPADPYGWTGADGIDTWESLTGIPSRRFWAQ